MYLRMYSLHTQMFVSVCLSVGQSSGEKREVTKHGEVGHPSLTASSHLDADLWSARTQEQTSHSVHRHRESQLQRPPHDFKTNWKSTAITQRCTPFMQTRGYACWLCCRTYYVLCQATPVSVTSAAPAFHVCADFYAPSPGSTPTSATAKAQASWVPLYFSLSPDLNRPKYNSCYHN